MSKRGIPNALLPENFSDDDLIAGKKGSSLLCYIQVKACHPDRNNTFLLQARHDNWVNAEDNEFVWKLFDHLVGEDPTLGVAEEVGPSEEPE